MRDTFVDEEWQSNGPDIESILDDIQVCGGRIDAITRSVSLHRDLPQSDKDAIERSLRDLHRRVDDAEVETSRII